jgi:23S rRNA (cytidine1920-2'-O)/16S rRNA (cytidine1409-2'-O)-methyltransferase
VEVREGVNARYLQPADFSQAFDLAVMDVSFISVTKVLPAVIPLVREGGAIITLIKPQFEVGRGEVGGSGIVRDAAKRSRVVEEVNAAAKVLGLSVVNVIESPIQGAEGNVEFLALYKGLATDDTD